MKIITGIEQGSQEWHDLRRSKVTGTRLDDVMGSSLARLQLIAELIAEEGTEQSKVMRPTAEMERGTAEEVFAVKAFEKKHDIEVRKATMCISDEFNWLAFSPDGLIFDQNGKCTEDIEVKSPDSKTVIFYKMVNMIDGIEVPKSKQHFLGVPMDYKWQVVQSFLVNTDLQKKNFVIYDARFIDEEAKLYVITIERSDPLLQEAIQQAKNELVRFRQDWLYYKEIVLPINF